jgi:phage-related protein
VTALAEVFVTVKPDMNKFGPEVKKKLTAIDTRKEGAGVAGRFGVGFNGAFGGIVKHSAGLFVGAFAAIKGVQFLTGFIEDARESAKVGRVSAAVIKSTGGVAGITAGQLGDLATAISNKTGADDEAIQSGENLLATFTNVRNETGKGNDVFNRATQAAVDMAAAMNGGVVDANGLKAANIQLGKALNDPVKGVTALSKVGVSFTQQQKDQIKTLVDSGKTLDAQKIILGEVGKEFGGAAAAASDPLVRLKTIAGNLSEQFGGYLLPVVGKFADFVSDTAIPKISAFSDVFAAKVLPKLKEFGGFIQADVIPRLVQFAGFFKDQILPRLLEFAGFLTGQVVPAVATLAKNLVSTFAPAVKDVFGFFKTEVLPRLLDFANFIGDKVLPKVLSLADSLSKNKDFLVPFVAVLAGGLVVFQAVSLAIKAWSAAQAILNVVLSANPIGLVVLLVAGLVAGLIYAYKHSAKFREVLQGAFDGIKKAAQVFAPLVKAAIDIVIGVFSLWWNAFAKPILERFGAALAVAWKLAQKFGSFVVAAFNSIKQPAYDALKWVIGKFLDFVGDMLNAAAKAFGWVPGLGSKLKKAANEFGTFRDNVNAALNGVKDQTITVTAKLNSANVNSKNATDRRLPSAGFADGGGVFGGERGKDSVPAMLMPDEHVWTTREVAAAGGHAAMTRLRRAALAGELNGYAAGGAVQVGVKPRTANVDRFAKDVAARSIDLVRPQAQALANQMFDAPGGPPGSRRSFRGVTLNQRTISMLLNAERILGAVFHITQGSYSTRVAASGSTHAGGGAMDTNGPRGWDVAVRALRQAGFASWHRTRSQGPWNDHIHSIALGDTSASPAAKAQMASFRRGGDGLGHGMGSGGKVGSYASGAWRILKDQLAMVHKNEMVVPAQPADDLRHWSSRLRSELHQRHEAHVAHEAHVNHELHANRIRLHPDDIQAIIKGIGNEVTSNPLQVNLDGRSLDRGLSRSALGRGY